MIFKKSEWLIKANKDKENGYLTQAEIDDALRIWVNDADGKTYAELGWDEAQMLEQEKAYQERLKKDKEVAYKKLVISKIRTRYSVDDEIAILRQENTKAAEFQEYNAFCEQCKAEAKSEVIK